MPSKTLESEDWVGMQRESLRRLGNEHPEELLPDGDPLRAIAFDYLQTRYAVEDVVSTDVSLRTANEWLVSQGIDPEEAARHAIRLTDLCRELYYDGAFREAVLRPLYEQSHENG